MEEKLVVLAEHPYERALLLQTRLKGEGIDSVLSNINLIQPDASAGVKVKVAEKDLEAAMKIYMDFLEEVGELPDEEERHVAGHGGVRRILVPVDFSSYSYHAALFAMHYASHVGAEILVLHAYYAPDVHTIPYDDETFGFQGTLTEYLTGLRETARKETLSFIEKLKKDAAKEGAGKVKMDYFIVKGSLDDAVFYADESYTPDLIVLGARGRDQRRNDPIGSMTARILEKASIPVLVIPEDAAIADFFKLKKIIYATSFDESDFQAVKKLMTLTAPFGMDILCTHFTKEEEDPQAQVRMEGLLKYFRDSYPGVKVECRIIRGEDVVDGLNGFILDHPVSAISLTTHRRNLIEKLFYPSVAKKMFFHTRVPLLVFHS
jgi:nucleotide-binding universal stress UspA family protein